MTRTGWLGKSSSCAYCSDTSGCGLSQEIWRKNRHFSPHRAKSFKYNRRHAGVRNGRYLDWWVFVPMFGAMQGWNNLYCEECRKARLLTRRVNECEAN